MEKDARVTANIRWHTDELTSTGVNFGIEQPDSYSVVSDQFSSDHAVELHSLKPDVTYKFKITTADIYGNNNESGLYSFSTEKSYRLEEDAHLEGSPEPLKLRSEMFRSEDNYLIRISANQDVSMEISTYDLADTSILQPNSSDFPENHPPMKSIYETNIVLCETCHLAPNEKFSHLEHFRAQLGNNIPPDYPMLPNGQMSCPTCHDAHSSNNEFHLRKSTVRELCIGCHKRSFGNRSIHLLTQ